VGAWRNLIVHVGAETGGFFTGMNSVLKTTGQVATKFVQFGAVAGTAILAVGVAATKMAADFQDQMADVSTLISGGPAEAMERFGKDVKRISVMTGKDLKNINEGLYETISAFGDSADAIAQLEIATKAAVGGKAETLDAVKMLSVVTKGYGDTSAAAVQKVADLAFQTANLGQTTFPELAASMGNVVPLAATLTVKQEELFGAMATLTGVTGNTSEVATQLRATMAALINPTSQMAAKLKKLGFSSGKTMIDTLGLQGTLDILAKSTGGNTAELADMFGRVEALNAVLALTGNQAADFTAKTDAMTKATGAADTAFAKKQETVNAMIARLKAMGTVALVEVGEKFLPVLMTAGDWITTNMHTIQAAMDTAFSVLGTVLETAGAAVTWFKDTIIAPFVAGFTGDMNTLRTPIEVFGAAARVVWDTIAGYLTNWRTNIWAPFVEGWTTGNTNMGGVLANTWATIGSVMNSIWEIIKGVVTLIMMFWNAWGDEIMAVVGVVWNTILGIIDGVLKVISGIVKFFVALFKGDWEGMKEALISIWEGLWKIITSLAEGFWNILKLAFDVVVKAIKGIWEWMTTDLVELWKGLWKDLTEWVPQAWEWLKTSLATLWTNISQWFIDLATAAVDWGKNLMQGFWDGITGMFDRIKESIGNFVGGITDKVKGLLGIASPSKVFEGIGTHVGEGFALGIQDTYGLVDHAMSGLAAGSVDVAMRAIQPASERATGKADNRPVHLHIEVGGKEVLEYVLDGIAGKVRPVARAMGSRA